MSQRKVMGIVVLLEAMKSPEENENKNRVGVMMTVEMAYVP